MGKVQKDGASVSDSLINKRVAGGYNRDESAQVLADVLGMGFSLNNLGVALVHEGFCTPRNSEAIARQLVAERGLILPTKPVWHWRLQGPFGTFEGKTEAFDAREAVSRAMTSQMGDGSLYGEACGVPLGFIDAAPGNAEPYFEHEEDGIRFEVRKLPKGSELELQGRASDARVEDTGLVEVPRQLLAVLTELGRMHVEDVESGLNEGIYEEDDNMDLPMRKSAVEEAEALVAAGHHLKYDYAQLSDDELAEVCRYGLRPGDLWRPSVEVTQRPEGFVWFDTEDDVPELNGPFTTSRDALINAIETEGVDDPEGWGLQRLTNSSAIEDDEEIADFISVRIESGDIALEDIATLMTRYGLMKPEAFREEMAGRLALFKAGSAKDDQLSPDM